MMDAAAMDTGIVTDHNAGRRQEYTWWRTEKSYDLFPIPGGYTPLFGYERSVPYPNGHRNVVFDQRGVHVLPISPAENQNQVNSGPVLYPYLKQNRGICMPHSLATGPGHATSAITIRKWSRWSRSIRATTPITNTKARRAPRRADYHVAAHGAYRPLGSTGTRWRRASSWAWSRVPTTSPPTPRTP